MTNAAKKFAHELSSPRLKPYSRLTIITNESDAHLEGENFTPEVARKTLETLEMRGGGTNFGKAI